MKKIVFDNSIHLGQFCITDDKIRIASKNSQVMLSDKNKDEVVGIESFNENAYSDDIIWGLKRDVQDTFYPFMDVYHSVKNVVRAPLKKEDAEMALKIGKEFNLDLSNALTCAIAIREKANEVHSCYDEFKRQDIKEFLQSFNVMIALPDTDQENVFSDGLEELYQAALQKFRTVNVNLPHQFHK